MILTAPTLPAHAYRLLTNERLAVATVESVKRAVIAVFLAAAAPSVATAGPLRTAVFASDGAPLTLERIHNAGATVVRINLAWAEVAPATLSPDFRAADPADPAYDWGEVDRQIKAAVAHGLQPLLTVISAPTWAQKDEPHPTHLGPYPINSWRPSPANLASFARAAAIRYGGSFAGLPRVRYWEVWDEPNLSQYLSPQLENNRVVSPDTYRSLVNAFANEAHAVHQDNVVAAGSLSAFSFLTPYGRLGIAPMLFMRRLLCMSTGANPKPTCNQTVSFDAWSHHPWTSGGPTHHASEKDDVSLGDLHEMHRLLNAAIQAGHVRSRVPVQFWITEFGWDTRPPDPHPEAAPIALQSRWVAEALYHAWKEGVSLFTWLVLRDRPYPSSALQSGLYSLNGDDFRDAVPKSTFRAFRFPFVAYRAGKRISLWGRTPYGRAGRVAVQQRTSTRWRWVGAFKAGSDGIFSGQVRYRPLPKRSKPTPSHSRGPSTYRDLVVSGAPTSYWRLDERSGSTAEDSVHADSGTFTGGVQLGLRGALPGSTGIGLNGTNARVKLGKVTNAHSVELWVKTRSLSDRAAFSDRNTGHAFLFFGTSGGLTFSFDDYAIRTVAVANGQWHHLVYTYDSTTSTGKVYVDGKLQSFAVYPRREGGADASIGYDASLKTFFKGQVDELAVYPYPLTAEQVRSHYAASGRTITPSVAPGMLRAIEQRSGISSLPFSLQVPPDRYVLPFGGGGPGFR
jgi:hypothetical protein